MKHTSFHIVMSGFLAVGFLALAANMAANAEETMKQRWNNGVQHTEARTGQILHNTANSTARVGNDIKNDTEKVGHRFSKGTRKVTHKIHKK